MKKHISPTKKYHLKIKKPYSHCILKGNFIQKKYYSLPIFSFDLRTSLDDQIICFDLTIFRNLLYQNLPDTFSYYGK